MAIDSTAPAHPPRAPAAAATPATPPVAPGTRVHNYVVEQLIGEGGMGAVWRVKQRMLKVPRAMKVLKVGTASVDRFEEEMEMLAMVTHDNVVKVIDSGVLPDGSLFYVMEHVEGRSLEADIAKHKGRRPQWEYVRDIILQICDGLAAIHDRGIIHRDMKPANCMLSPGVNEVVHVKIVDLGIARRSSVMRPGSTSDGMFIGSAAYASPEQAAGETTTLTYGSDVYSVGIILYELLTGVIPHVADAPTDRAAMLRRRVVGTLPPLPSLHVRPGTIPPEIDEIIVRCLQPDPRDRFQSISELAEAIRQTPDLPRQLRKTRPSQSLTSVAADILPSDSSASLAMAAQSGSGLRVIPSAQETSGVRSVPSSSGSGMRVLPQELAARASASGQSSSHLTPLPPSQSSPGAPISAPALDSSTLIADRPRRRPTRLLLLGGGAAVVAVAAAALAIPGLRARLFGESIDIIGADEREPAEFARARTAIQRLGLQEAADVQSVLQRYAADREQTPGHVATARLLEAELVLMRAIACQIAVALDPIPGAAAAYVQTDPARAAELLAQVPRDHTPVPQARVRALLRLARGESVDTPVDPDLSTSDRDELLALAGAAPLWRKGHAVPADLIPPLQRLRTPSTLVRSALALGLWRAGEDSQAHRLLLATLKMASDQPAARATFDALLRSHDGDAIPAPPVPEDSHPAPPAAVDPVQPAAPKAGPPRPIAEKFASIDEQVEAGCQRVRKGDHRSGVKVLMDALNHGAEFESNFDLCVCLGEGFARQRAHDVSLQWFRRALRLDPVHPGALAGAARAADLLGREERALELYRRLLEVDPRNAAAQAYVDKHYAPPSPEENGPFLPVEEPSKAP
ncbi:MAG: serine/threonine protein kinase [Myxococcales bacterium]|nr:serine/threonine protein kinase [Myxococcales bacterium]